jgi:alkylation response protein AidB-like acyl-CoA dehydrogenase
MFIAYEQAKSMACLACSKADFSENEKDRKRAISAAKIKISDNARHVSQEAIQLHGGMGMTEELKVSHTFRRLTVITEQFGGADYHLERFSSL